MMDPGEDGYVPFTTYQMVRKAHQLGMLVKPWTVCECSVLLNFRLPNFFLGE